MNEFDWLYTMYRNIMHVTFVITYKVINYVA